ncbi:MAG: flagellar assembly protein FliW [Gemmatimonadetes bacterium]|nr:flagellar assembly protein FliW [Gemmatimonadota bacterium]MBI3568295.1 flagellar assembly protein FliW [Gemmatimonadota bacterium]
MTAPLLAVPVAGARRTIPTELFGPLDIAEEHIIEFSEGILGFPACHGWVLIDGAKPGTAWLQSVEYSALVFLLADPFVFFEGFTAELSPTELRRLDAREPGQLAVFAIVTLPERRSGDATANLQGPIIINVHSRRGAQVVLGESSWSVRQPISFG